MADLDDRRRQVLDDKLGSLANWRVPDVENGIGPCDPTVFHEFRERLAPLVARCEQEIRSYTDQQIEILMSEDSDDPDGLRNRWNRFADSDLYRIKKRRPPWYAGGFGHSDYQADFAYWARMPRFSLSEATCLSVGIDPTHFTQDRIEGLAGKRRDELWSPLVFLFERFEQLKRVFGSGRVEAWYFAGWAMKFEFEMDPTFFELLIRYHVNSNETSIWPQKNAKSNKREIDKIAQLITAVAIVEYGYDPDAKRSPIPKEISDLAAEMGLEIHPDTIRKYLRIGADFLPKDWKANRD